MAEEKNTLQQELDKLEPDGLTRLAQLWNIPNVGKEKRTIIKRLLLGMQDDFYVKGVLEKLSSTQVTIYSSLLSSKSKVMTLGDIARKISVPPMNAEMELGVLKRYYLVYQRKNRERLTNNLDRYYFYSESGSHVQVDFNERNKKLKVSLPKALLGRPLSPEWHQILKSNVHSNGYFDTKSSAIAAEPENLAKLISHWSPIEQEVVRSCFYQGGILEMSSVRELLHSHKKGWEYIVRKLNDSGLVLDEYYIDGKFIRVMLLPQEVFSYLQKNPLPLNEKKGLRERQSKKICNDMDFFLNIKKLIAYISCRGISLAKSAKIKQVDLREMEDNLLHNDIGLFIEKSQSYQVELLLPVMRLLDIVRVKNQDVVLRNDYEKIIKMNYAQLIPQVLEAVLTERQRRSFYEDIFTPMEVPFPRQDLWEECIAYIQKYKHIMHRILIAIIVRNRLVLERSFCIHDFQLQLSQLSRELISVLFYLQLFGLIQVEYPERWLSISELGHHVFSKKTLAQKDQKGSLIINADMSIVAIPEKLSLESLLLLKSFADIKSFDNVYTFQISKRSLQKGILLKEKPKDFVQMLKNCSRREPSQNFLFSIKDWSTSLPLVQIADECVIIQTKEAKHMELLLGQINGKRVVQEKISKNTILLHPNKIPEVIEAAEKLELLVNLVR